MCIISSPGAYGYLLLSALLFEVLSSLMTVVRRPFPQTPLQVAINNKQHVIVGLLTASKAKLEFDDPASALCAAAGVGDLAQVKRLIENGADPNVGDYDRRTGDGL